MLTAATTTARRLAPVVESTTLAEELATLCQPFEATNTKTTDYRKCDRAHPSPRTVGQAPHRYPPTLRDTHHANPQQPHSEM